MKDKAQRKTVTVLLIAVLIMFGFSFALVPLYRVACKKIGLNTSIPITTIPDAPVIMTAAETSVEKSRNLNVQFLSINNRQLSWEFYPRTKMIKVSPGEKVKVEYYAKNNTDQDMTVQAVPSMTPSESIKHFHKIECFCFSQQSLKAGESKNMALVFQVDKDLPKDVHTITLAYTLFDVTQHAKKKEQG